MLITIMLIIFSTIAGRLFFLQVVEGQEYKERSNNKSIRQIPDAADSGCERQCSGYQYPGIYAGVQSDR